VTGRAARIAVVGAGAWGTALALVAARAGADVVLWGRDAALVEAITATLENPAYLPGIRLEPAIRATLDPADAAGAEIVLFAVPTQVMRQVATEFAGDVDADAFVISCAKGIERATGRLTTDILGEVLPGREALVLSGPSFATDVARGLPTAVTIAAAEFEAAERVCRCLAGPVFRPYASADPTGVQVGGALKNVFAIAAGVVAGRGLGASAEAALLARGMAEMNRIATAFGGRAETLMGLSGLGDLVLTCRSLQSRNFSYGHALGTGASPGEVKTVEGVATAGIAAEWARAAGVEAPIITAVSDVLAHRIGIPDAVSMLMARPLKREGG